MRTLRTTMLGLGFAVALASASVAAPNPPQAGYPQNNDIGAVITNTLRTPATVTGTPAVQNNSWRGVVCTFLGTASSGSPTETWSIEGFDAATNSWYQIATTATFQWGPYNTFLPKTLTVYPGVAVGSLSTGNAAQSAVLPKLWRLKDVVAGSGTAVTSKAGCNYID